MTERISADDFQRKYGGGTPKPKKKSHGEDGTRWSCTMHEGWNPLPIPHECPVCGEPLTMTRARRSGQVPEKFVEAWRKREEKG